MQKPINILVIDDNQNLCQLLHEYFSMQEDFTFCGMAHNGVQAVELLKKVKPDVIILDIIMPNLDGIGVLEELNMNKAKNRPKVIVLTSMHHEMMARQLYGLGVDYYILKPFDLEVLGRRVRQLFKKDTVDNLRIDEEYHEKIGIKVTTAIHQMRIPAHIKGFRYLRDAVIMAVKEINLVDSVTKEIYATLAERYITTPTSVERAMRHAISIAWEKGNLETMSYFFGAHAHLERDKPTNSEFIAQVADKFRKGV